MSDPEQAAVFRALGSEHRRKLLDLLRAGPQTTGALAAHFPGLSRYAVMQHLGVLAEAHLVLYRHEGRQRLNFINPVPLQRAAERWLRPLARQVGANVLALERHLTPPLEAAMTESSYRVIRIEAELNIERPPAEVFAALTTGLDAWWPHRTRPTARIVYEPQVGGRVYEDWGNGGGLAYGQVMEYAPGERHVLVFTGGFGTRIYMSKNIETVTAAGEGTRYQKTLIMAGEVPEEMEGMYRSGVGKVAQALKQHLEAGAA